MANNMTTDTSFWVKVLRDSDLSVDDNTLSQYATVLTDRFATIEDLLAVDENELINLGIENQLDRACLIKQARILDEKESLPLTRQSAASSRILENWRDNNQSTPLNPKSKCNLSPALLSRISFNDHPNDDELPNFNKKNHFEHIIETPTRSIMTDTTEKIQTLIESCQKKNTPTSSTSGMRTMKSLSNTISLQKRIIAGADRLKRLALTRSLLKRQTTLITKKVSNITNKFINPFAKMKNKNNRTVNDNTKITPRRTTSGSSIKLVQENEERRKIQVLSLNNDIRRSTDLISHQNGQETKRTAQSVPTLTNKRFKLGATTTFLTRSLSHHSHNE